MGAVCGGHRTNIDTHYTSVSEGNVSGIIRIFDNNSKRPLDVTITLQNNTIQTQTADSVQTLVVNADFTVNDFEEIYTFIKYKGKDPLESVNEVVDSTRGRRNFNPKMFKHPKIDLNYPINTSLNDQDMRELQTLRSQVLSENNRQHNQQINTTPIATIPTLEVDKEKVQH